jgi:hypothetical protein
MAKPTNTPETLTLVLNWQESAKIIALSLERGRTVEGRDLAKQELLKMARAADLAAKAVDLVERFLKIDNWHDDLIAPKALITDARELMRQVGRTS